ncbi:MAG: hypothetical protein ITG02_13825 [Patulibacter sp.]|nr:hypothetical protein [Patulibacter sp.]
MARSIAAGFGLAATTIIASLAAAATAPAAPSDQRIRIEGRSATLFEGPVRTDGHTIKAASDNRPRPCDGSASGGGPNATPTAAADDAMRLTGQTFDGRWGSHQDYFVTRFGPDGQEPGSAAYWGIVVNGIYTSVGGCQYRLKPGDQTLWLYDAFNAKPQLRLDGPGSIGEATAAVEGGPSVAPVQQVFTVGLAQPFPVSVQQSVSRGDVGAPGARGPAAGVMVAPVVTDATGWQAVVRGGAGSVVTGPDGRATLSWDTPGWKRIKADGDGFVRSNRLDVCVLPCGPAPADALARTAPPTTLPAPDPGTGTGSGSLVDGSSGSSSGDGGGRALPTITLGPSKVDGLRVTTDGHASGRVGVRWTVQGAPLRAWRIESRTKRRKPGGRWSTEARGSDETTAMLDLPTGRTAELRVRLTGASGVTVTRKLPSVVVPVDDRLRSVRFGGRWARDRDVRAWRLTTTRMRKGATVKTRIRAGRPTLVVRSDRRTARIEMRVGNGKPQRLKVRGRKDGRTVFVTGRRSKKTATVRVKVLSGTVHVDGVAARP